VSESGGRGLAIAPSVFAFHTTGSICGALDNPGNFPVDSCVVGTSFAVQRETMTAPLQPRAAAAMARIIWLSYHILR
jgi:hypothetical protein